MVFLTNVRISDGSNHCFTFATSNLSENRVLTIPGVVDDTVVLASATQTISDKTLTACTLSSGTVSAGVTLAPGVAASSFSNAAGTATFALPSQAGTYGMLARVKMATITAATATISQTAGWVLQPVDSTAQAVVVTLPPPAANLGIYTIYDAGGLAAANPIEISNNSGEKIAGSTSNFVLNAPFNSITVFSDGTDWHMI